jgi:hypothetical protein
LAGRLERALPWLLPLVVLLPDLRAALPGLSYYFRDFTVTFYPLRLFAARELAEGRFPFWNPYLHEGSFMLPAAYPLDLLLALWPSVSAASWLLTWHLPLAAVLTYALGRELGLSRPGAFGAGVAYSLSGLSLSSLNLWVYLQCLALAPLVALAFRRAARDGGRAVAWAALALAACGSTLALEWAGQAALLALALGWDAAPGTRGLRRMGLALALAAGLLAAPAAVVAGLLPETVRGAGLTADVLTANSVHPVALLQGLVPGLFGPVAPPAEQFWGGRFFSKGYPYFSSLYVGAPLLALAFVGLGSCPPRRRALLVGFGLLGLWVALGSWGGLAPLLFSLPGVGFFRFPVKALFLPHAALALLVGHGVSALVGREAWSRLGRAAALASLPAAGLATVALLAPARLASGLGLALSEPGPVAGFVAGDAAVSALVGVLLAGLALGVRHGRVGAAGGTAVALTILALDLARAGAGINPQVAASFFDLPEELRAERLDALAGQRVFSFETEASPAVRAFLASPARGRVAGSFLLHRRLLGPYTNVIDGVETALGKDLTSFAPRVPELSPAEYDPRGAAAILPALRDAAVSRVLTLDALDAPGLELRRSLPAGVRELTLRVYAVRDPLPRAYIACRLVPVADAPAARRAALGRGFDGTRDVALEASAAAPACASGSAQRVALRAGHEAYDVEADGAGFLVTRDSFARGWGATLDGAPVAVLRANGKHRAVAVPGGRHRVELRYRPPGLAAGLAVFALATLATGALLLRRARPARAVAL